MQEKEKQGVNPVENKVLLYSGKPRVRTGKDLLAFRRIPLFQVCFGITVFLSYLRGLAPLGWAMAAAQFQVPAHSCLPPPAVGHTLPWIGALRLRMAGCLCGD